MLFAAPSTVAVARLSTLKLQRVHNAKLWAAFQASTKGCTNKLGRAAAPASHVTWRAELMVVHGTAASSAQSIAQVGFDPTKFYSGPLVYVQPF